MIVAVSKKIVAMNRPALNMKGPPKRVLSQRVYTVAGPNWNWGDQTVMMRRAEVSMAEEWMIRGTEFTNCNCNSGCPCQFGSPSTLGHCEAFIAGSIEEGYFGKTRLDGLNWALLVQWPGEIAAGNGKQQVIIDERANDSQREALRKILQGESTKPGATHFFVFNSTMSSVLPPLFAPIEMKIDVDARTADIQVADIIESAGRPTISPFNGEPVRHGVHLPNGFEFTYAEVGKGVTESRGAIKLALRESHGHFNVLHMNQDGPIRK